MMTAAAIRDDSSDRTAILRTPGRSLREQHSQANPSCCQRVNNGGAAATARSRYVLRRAGQGSGRDREPRAFLPRHGSRADSAVRARGRRPRNFATPVGGRLLGEVVTVAIKVPRNAPSNRPGRTARARRASVLRRTLRAGYAAGGEPAACRDARGRQFHAPPRAGFVGADPLLAGGNFSRSRGINCSSANSGGRSLLDIRAISRRYSRNSSPNRHADHHGRQLNPADGALTQCRETVHCTGPPEQVVYPVSRPVISLPSRF